MGGAGVADGLWSAIGTCLSWRQARQERHLPSAPSASTYAPGHRVQDEAPHDTRRSEQEHQHRKRHCGVVSNVHLVQKDENNEGHRANDQGERPVPEQNEHATDNLQKAASVRHEQPAGDRGQRAGHRPSPARAGLHPLRLLPVAARKTHLPSPPCRCNETGCDQAGAGAKQRTDTCDAPAHGS